MITYLYWIAVLAATGGVFYLALKTTSKAKTAFIAAGICLFVGWAAYFFHFEQMFVKRWGGVMTVKVPKGQHHIAATWKDDNLWIENYDPEKNECIFSEYSKGNLLEGRVHIKDCNPLMPQALPASE